MKCAERWLLTGGGAASLTGERAFAHPPIFSSFSPLGVMLAIPCGSSSLSLSGF